MTQETARASERPRLVVEAMADLSALPLLSNLIHRFLVDGCGLGAESPETARIRLALHEAVTNVVRHAYAGREAGPIALELAREGDELVARLRDQGPRFDPRGTRRSPAAVPRPDPSRMGDIREGGYGLGIIQDVMTFMDHTYDAARGNELVLRKTISEA